MRWYCWHNWSKWSEYVSTYEAPYQFRYCKKCNLIKRKRRALTGNGVNPQAWNHSPDNDADKLK